MATPNEQVGVTRDGRNIWVRFPYISNGFWYKVQPDLVSLCLSSELAHEVEKQLHNTLRGTNDTKNYKS